MRRWVIILGAALAGVLLAASTARASSGPPVKPPRGPNQKRLRELLGHVADYGALPGFERFAEAVALGESSFNPDARNESALESRQAEAGLDGALGRGFYEQNPSVVDDRGAWTFGSGGWFGFLPSTALAAGGRDGPWAQAHPRAIFDPVESIVMAADYAARILRHYVSDLPAREQTWMALRRGWVRPALAADWQERNPRSIETRKRFERRLQTALGWTPAQARAFANRPVGIGTYDGPERLLDFLRSRS